jgi:phosphohistidine phosphatase
VPSRKGEADGSAPDDVVKALYLLRHAKSSWDDQDLPDHDRPLAPRGQRAARKLADHLLRVGVTPELVLCSTARRATETLDAIMPAFEPAPEVRLEEELYHASAEDLVRRVEQIPATVPSVLLIGHNPSIQAAALALARGGDQALIARLRDKMATGALATLELDGEWSAAAAGTTRLVSFVVPRELP